MCVASDGALSRGRLWYVSLLFGCTCLLGFHVPSRRTDRRTDEPTDRLKGMQECMLEKGTSNLSDKFGLPRHGGRTLLQTERGATCDC